MVSSWSVSSIVFRPLEAQYIMAGVHARTKTLNAWRPKQKRKKQKVAGDYYPFEDTPH
jgi:hypothetical protein